jgi:hypothetical protein
MTAMGGFTPEAFRVAWLVQYPVWLVAVIGVLVMRRQARGHPGALVSHAATDQFPAVAADLRIRTGGSECATAASIVRPVPERGARSV